MTVSAVAGRSVTIVPNPDYAAGMLSSVRCGLEALPDQCDAVMVALGDQPAITTEAVDALAGAFRAGTTGILVPVYGGKRGHPITFSRAYCDEVLTDHDAAGLRGLLHAHPEDVGEVTVQSPGVLTDIDSPEDYRRLMEKGGA